jgi:hypothetical protein
MLTERRSDFYSASATLPVYECYKWLRVTRQAADLKWIIKTSDALCSTISSALFQLLMPPTYPAFRPRSFSHYT